MKLLAIFETFKHCTRFLLNVGRYSLEEMIIKPLLLRIKFTFEIFQLRVPCRLQ